MTRSILWKEWREQGFVVMALMLTGCGLLTAAYTLVESSGTDKVTRLSSFLDVGRLGLLLMSITTGLVVGASLFAGEREAGSFQFLDMLPGTRWAIWWRKTLIGALLISLPVTVFLALSTSFGTLGNDQQILGWWITVFVLTMTAYGWGGFGSVFGKTSMAACGIGLAASGIAAITVTVITAIVIQVDRAVFHLFEHDSTHNYALPMLVAFFAIFFMPLGLSALMFTAPDRGRHLRSMDVRVPNLYDVRRKAVRRARSLNPLTWFPGFRRLLWIVRRQFWLQFIVSIVLAVILGSFLHIPDVSATMIYPIPSLILGVVVGVTLWNDEQTGRSLRFWSERRLPIGRLWLMKMVSGFGMLLLCWIILLMPMILFGGSDRSASRFSDRLFGFGLAYDFHFPIVQFLFLWAFHGFFFGSLFGLLFQKGIVAGAVALMVSAGVAGLWFPTAILGELHFWQWLTPLLIVTLLARSLLWLAATDRLATPAGVRRMIFGFTLLLASIGGGLAYRAFSHEDVPERDADIAFAASIPSFDLEQPGRDLRRAFPLLESQLQRLSGERTVRLFPNDSEDHPGTWRSRGAGGSFTPGQFGPTLIGPNHEMQIPFEDQLHLVLKHGVPQDEVKFTRWLNAMGFELDEEDKQKPAEWENLLATAAKKPVGVLDDPTEVFLGSPLRYSGKIELLFRVYMIRGLYLQTLGKPEAFLDRLEITFKLMQTVRNRTFYETVESANTVEAEALIALDRWLERLEGRPELLKRALTILQARESLPAHDPYECTLALQTVIRNSYKLPSMWMQQPLNARNNSLGMPASSAVEMEVAAVGFSVLVPWEQERMRRLISLGNVKPTIGVSNTDHLFSRVPCSLLTFDRRRIRPYTEVMKLATAYRRASLLKVAIRVYEQRKSSMPVALKELVKENILPEVPADPFDKQEFRYRLSAGERINLQFSLSQRQRMMSMTVPGGQTIPTAPGMAPPWIGGDAGGGMAAGGPPGTGPGFASMSFPVVFSPMDLENFFPFAAVYGGPMGVLEFSWDPITSPQIVELQRQERELTTRYVPKNQGILWSVGPDGVDDMGHSNMLDSYWRYEGTTGDLVFVVPPPKGKYLEEAPEPRKKK